jgi:hypothetical protein
MLMTQYGSAETGGEPASGNLTGSGISSAQPAVLLCVGDSPVGIGATIGAVALSLFIPVIALVVALVMRSQEQRPSRRRFLKNWAIGSAAWTCTGWLIPLIAFSAVSPVTCQVPGGG